MEFQFEIKIFAKQNQSKKSKSKHTFYIRFLKPSSGNRIEETVASVADKNSSDNVTPLNRNNSKKSFLFKSLAIKNDKKFSSWLCKFF